MKNNVRNKLKIENHLVVQLQSMIRDTAAGRLSWDVECSTTEYNKLEHKPVEMIDGKKYIVDECYVSYHTTYLGKEFLMITYEMLHTSQDDIKSMNLVFLPPLGNRYFDVQLLLPYAVETDQVFMYQVHNLWDTVLERYKTNPSQINLSIDSRELTIEE